VDLHSLSRSGVHETLILHILHNSKPSLIRINGGKIIRINEAKDNPKRQKRNLAGA
jgi:hypothetical protein